MRYIKKASTIIASLTLSLANVCFADLNTSAINNNAQGYLSNAIGQTSYPISVAWAALANFYSNTGGFPPANTFNINTSFTPNIASITNNNLAGLIIVFSKLAPGPLANKTIVLSPTRVSILGSVSYVFEIPLCFTNISDTLIGAAPPPTGTSVASVSNSGLGFNCVFAPDPVAAASNQVQGGGAGPSSSPVGG